MALLHLSVPQVRTLQRLIEHTDLHFGSGCAIQAAQVGDLDHEASAPVRIRIRPAYEHDVMLAYEVGVTGEPRTITPEEVADVV